jgi:hypothetical protein
MEDFFGNFAFIRGGTPELWKSAQHEGKEKSTRWTKWRLVDFVTCGLRNAKGISSITRRKFARSSPGSRVGRTSYRGLFGRMKAVYAGMAETGANIRPPEFWPGGESTSRHLGTTLVKLKASKMEQSLLSSMNYAMFSL